MSQLPATLGSMSNFSRDLRGDKSLSQLWACTFYMKKVQKMTQSAEGGPVCRRWQGHTGIRWSNMESLHLRANIYSMSEFSTVPQSARQFLEQRVRGALKPPCGRGF